MRWLRTTDFAAYRRIGYEFQILYAGESCRVIGSSVAAKAAAPPRHIHPVDQLYYVVHGEMHGVLGSEPFVAGPNTLVFIPAGTPHHNWNEGNVDEFHFEVLVPSPHPNEEVMTPTDSHDAGGRRYLVRELREDGFVPTLDGFAIQKLLQRSDGSQHIALYVGLVEPGGAGPDTHIHRFDQFYYVLDGELSVEVGLDGFTACAHDLVVLPAGVPHRQWNDGAGPERHLTLIVPEPAAGDAWDIGVSFAPTGAVLD